MSHGFPYIVYTVMARLAVLLKNFTVTAQALQSAHVGNNLILENSKYSTVAAAAAPPHSKPSNASPTYGV